MKKSFLLILSLCVLFSGLYAQTPEVANNCLSLDSCIALAVENNYEIENAQLQIQAAKQTKKAAFTKYFPSVSIMGGAFMSNKNLIDIDLDISDINLSSPDENINNLIQTLYGTYGEYFSDITANMQMINNGVVAGVTAIQPVYAGGRIVTGNKLAAIGVSAAEKQMIMSENEVRTNVESSFWMVVSLQEKINTVNVALELLDTLYKDVSGACDAGLAMKNDVMKVKLKQNELKANRLKAENGIVTAKKALCVLIGIDYSDTLVFYEPVSSCQDPFEMKVDEKTSLNNRVESQLLNMNVEAERLKKRMTVGETLPQLGIGAGYTYNNIMDKNKTTGLVFATLSVPLSGWWEASYNIKKQRLNVQIAENTRDNMNKLLLLQMQQAWNEALESYELLQLAQETIDEAEENYRLSNDYYVAGMETITELLQAQTILQQSHDQYCDAFIQYRIKQSQYKQLTNR